MAQPMGPTVRLNCWRPLPRSTIQNQGGPCTKSSTRIRVHRSWPTVADITRTKALLQKHYFPLKHFCFTKKKLNLNETKIDIQNIYYHLHTHRNIVFNLKDQVFGDKKNPPTTTK